ncbi:hypothetical protein NPIL_342751 [Nephila pilipes]|uniref:Uncharacterized protein n=1 Tax=Nephila pilipes TaxID=299642 RepID=A0A8X6PUJ9_NEPPI|nr:hypothetical protein NPIL_342751 [Nephila pilipes]
MDRQHPMIRDIAQNKARLNRNGNQLPMFYSPVFELQFKCMTFLVNACSSTQEQESGIWCGSPYAQSALFSIVLCVADSFGRSMHRWLYDTHNLPLFVFVVVTHDLYIWTSYPGHSSEHYAHSLQRYANLSRKPLFPKRYCHVLNTKCTYLFHVS